MTERNHPARGRHAPLIDRLTPEERAALAAELLSANVRDAIQTAIESTSTTRTDVPAERSASVDQFQAVMGPDQAAAYCAIGVNRMRDLLRVGAIQARRSGRRWLVRREALDEWMRREEEAERRRRTALIRPREGAHGSGMIRRSIG